MPQYKLIYFKTRGRAEAIRLLFAAAGVKYEDCRLEMEEFRQLKASGKLPFNQLPILEVDDKILAQTPTIIRYLGRETGFAPINSFDIAKADMIGDALTDTLQKAHKAYLEKDEELKKKMTKEFYEETLPNALNLLEKIVKSSSGKYFVTDKLTYADINFFASMDLLFPDTKDIPPIFDNYPCLKCLYYKF
ncbi:glutathione S-transferase 1-like isoform X1 [Xenia sp. Carnegie-2017]|uniref:glutathione S-transferase 1-like isoform X1 n=2 Tax=Xenia sp. Carnegie-2017 TaxID=2897299 RepID=UPI001F044C7A|nr:glutathione S-transferase 1-like isoform X1 [Xenia sp. Carnegie-2017]